MPQEGCMPASTEQASSYPELDPRDAVKIKAFVEMIQERIGARRGATIKPGFTADLHSCGEAHKHPIYKIDHAGHITIKSCSACGTHISAARPSTGVLVEFNLKDDGQIDVFWGEGHQDLDAARSVPTWLIRELEWALDSASGDGISHPSGMGCSAD